MIRLLIILSFLPIAEASVLVEHRYTEEIKRDVRGRILRRADVIAAFKRQHPCPVNGKTYGKCPGWAIDHVIPLACKGKDAVSNMQWLPLEIKSCKGQRCKDRFERKIYKLKSNQHC